MHVSWLASLNSQNRKCSLRTSRPMISVLTVEALQPTRASSKVEMVAHKSHIAKFATLGHSTGHGYLQIFRSSWEDKFLRRSWRHPTFRGFVTRHLKFKHECICFVFEHAAPCPRAELCLTLGNRLLFFLMKLKLGLSYTALGVLLVLTEQRHHATFELC